MKNKTTAGLLAIFLGIYGAHYFYLGNKEKAIAYLLITLLSLGLGATVISILSLIDGIRIFCMNDKEFLSIIQSDIDNNMGSKTIKKDESSKFKSLKKAKELFDIGAITEQEFYSIKNKILEE